MSNISSKYDPEDSEEDSDDSEDSLDDDSDDADEEDQQSDEDGNPPAKRTKLNPKVGFYSLFISNCLIMATEST